jgi:hypothetical protein
VQGHGALGRKCYLFYRNAVEGAPWWSSFVSLLAMEQVSAILIPGCKTYSTSPRSEILQGVCHNLHAVAQHSLDIHFLIFVCHSGQEEYKSTARFEQVSRKTYKVGGKI